MLIADKIDHSFFYLASVYGFLFIFSCERSLFIFITSSKSPIASRSLITIIPFLLYILLFFVAVLDFSLNKKTSIFLIFPGLIIFLTGIFLRYSAVSLFETKGQKWSTHVSPDFVTQLIMQGVYKHLKHPYYLSVILELFGIALFLGSYFTLFLIVLIQLPLILKRIQVEERFLLDKFGSLYVEYKSKTNPTIF